MKITQWWLKWETDFKKCGKYAYGGMPLTADLLKNFLIVPFNSCDDSTLHFLICLLRHAPPNKQGISAVCSQTGKAGKKKHKNRFYALFFAAYS
jgi:hypothetical protein